MKAQELIKELRKLGWQEERQKGSHRIFKHPMRAEIIVVPDHGKKDIPTGTLKSILKRARQNVIDIKVPLAKKEDENRSNN